MPEHDGQGCSGELARLRNEINALDARLLELLNRRAALSLAVGALKRQRALPVFCREREAEILAGLEADNRGPLNGAQLRKIYAAVFEVSKELQR